MAARKSHIIESTKVSKIDINTYEREKIDSLLKSTLPVSNNYNYRN